MFGGLGILRAYSEGEGAHGARLGLNFYSSRFSEYGFHLGQVSVNLTDFCTTLT